MSTTIDNKERTIADLLRLPTYADMTDEEIDRIIDYKIELAVSSQELLYKKEAFEQVMLQHVETQRAACERSTKMLEYMCGQKVMPASVAINKIEFHPLEFNHE